MRKQTSHVNSASVFYECVVVISVDAGRSPTIILVLRDSLSQLCQNKNDSNVIYENDYLMFRLKCKSVNQQMQQHCIKRNVYN